MQPRAWIVIIGIAALLFVLRFAEAFIVPVLLGILASYALRPLVEVLVRWRFHRALAAALVIVTLISGVAWVGYSIRTDVVDMINSLPESARKLRARLSSASAQSAPLKSMQEAAKEFDKAAAEAAGSPAPRGAAVPVPLTSSLFARLVDRSSAALAFLAQILIMLLIAFFLLCAGDLYRRKLVRLIGTTLSQKKITVLILGNIDAQIQYYMLTTVACNALIALATWIAFEVLGVNNAGFWGVTAGVLHFIPYLGSLLVFAASMAAGFLQFGSLWTGLLVGLTSLVIAGLVGLVLMTWLQSSVSKVNAPVLFVAMFLFAWLWGAWGLILGPPLVAIAKVVFDHVESLQPLGDMMGAGAGKPEAQGPATQ
jgi:predicted PurR-regulated permease PerM